jgi:hypothetical protein
MAKAATPATRVTGSEGASWLGWSRRRRGRSSLGYSGFADWPILEGRYTLAVLFEYAATLGLID